MKLENANGLKGDPGAFVADVPAGAPAAKPGAAAEEGMVMKG